MLIRIVIVFFIVIFPFVLSMMRLKLCVIKSKSALIEEITANSEATPPIGGDFLCYFSNSTDSIQFNGTW